MTEKIYTYESDAASVTWDKNRCIHAAACVRGLPEVFNPKERRWVRPENATADALLDVVAQCPTGALHLARKDGGAEEAALSTTTATIAPDGPLFLHGEITIETPDGEAVLADTRVALCRCGLSSNKPFCDNSHRGAFADAGHLTESACAVPAVALGSGPVRIVPRANGSVFFEGPVTVVASDGTAVTREKGAFCRCGASANKPFCDGAHRSIGFEAP
jgi:CDGSH-type Zn-finger protein/uncharacterized Fe-S cluster protein YjdI